MQALLWLAVACGIAGALTGNRTAWPLLASVGLCKALEWLHVSFDPALWLVIDFAVIAVIVRRDMKPTDWIVLALFAPAWAAYFLPDPARYNLSLAAVSLQLLLTFPMAATWGRTRRINRTFDPWDHFNLRARHGA